MVPLGKVKRQDTFLQEPQQAARSLGCSYSWFCRTGRDAMVSAPGPAYTLLIPTLCLSLSPETRGGALEMAGKETPSVLCVK